MIYYNYDMTLRNRKLPFLSLFFNFFFEILALFIDFKHKDKHTWEGLHVFVPYTRHSFEFDSAHYYCTLQHSYSCFVTRFNLACNCSKMRLVNKMNDLWHASHRWRSRYLWKTLALGTLSMLQVDRQSRRWRLLTPFWNTRPRQKICRFILWLMESYEIQGKWDVDIKLPWYPQSKLCLS